MYIPNTTIIGSIVPVTGGIDIGLNTLLGIGWHILLPYTFLGIGLMLWSQSRLYKGERELRRQTAVTRERQPTSKKTAGFFTLRQSPLLQKLF